MSMSYVERILSYWYALAAEEEEIHETLSYTKIYNTNIYMTW